MKNQRVVIEMLRKAVKNYEDLEFANDREEKIAADVLIKTAMFALYPNRKSSAKLIAKGMVFGCALISIGAIFTVSYMLPNITESDAAISIQTMISEMIRGIVS